MKIKDLDKFTNAEKILLAEELWESVSKEKIELSDAIKNELDRRIALVEENKTEFYTWEDVKNTLKKAEMYKLVFSKEALLDIEQISIWYEEQREGLSYDFELCLEESVSQIFRNPEHFQVKYKNVKVRFIKRFPYGIHYMIYLDKIIVLGVFHTSRSPINWSKRLK